MSREMSSMQRFEAVLSHQTPDCVPISFIGGIFETHFVPGMTVVQYASSGLNMAKANIAFHEAVGADTIFCLSDVGLVVQGYGVRMKLSDQPDIHMAFGKFPINEPGDWEKLDVLDPRVDGRMGVYLDACRICRDKYGDSVPIGVSIPSPLTCATRVCSMEDVMVQMITDPEALKKGLTALTGTVEAFTNECIRNGAYFTWYLGTRASKEIVTLEQYNELGAPFDEAVFSKTPDAIHIVHICGVEPMFELVDEWRQTYRTVKGVSWWSQGATPNLKQAKQLWPQLVLMSGIDHTNTLVMGSLAEIDREVAQACEDAMSGSGLIMAPGCEPSPKTPRDSMIAAVNATRKHGKYS